MSVMFYNPSTSGGSDTSPTFQLFQNWGDSGIIPAESSLYFWFGGNRWSSLLPSLDQNFYYAYGFEFTITKLYMHHSPIFNAEQVDFNLIDANGGTSVLLGSLNGILPSQTSEIICNPNLITPGQQIYMETFNSQYANVFTVYQMTALCQKI